MPWQLAYELIRTYSGRANLVLDVCGGTGTTGVAALMTGRQYLLFEPWDDARGSRQEAIGEHDSHIV